MQRIIRAHFRRKKGGKRKCVSVKEYIRGKVAWGRKVVYPDLAHIRLRMRKRKERRKAQECTVCKKMDLLVQSGLEKLLSGKIAWVRRKLRLAVEQKVGVKNETGLDLDWDWKENLDGSKPSLIIELKRVFHRDSEEPPRDVL